MSIHRSTYVFYGVRVPADQYAPTHLWDECDRIDGMIRRFRLEGAGRLASGPYDWDDLYLVVGDTHEVTPDEPWQADPRPLSSSAKQTVYMLAARLGYSGIGPVRLTVVVDEG